MSITIKDTICTHLVFDRMTVNEIIKFLQNTQEENPQYSQMILEEYRLGIYKIVGTRPENDKEKQNRIKIDNFNKRLYNDNRKYFDNIHRLSLE